MSDKTAIMERLIRNINHEIKNPLTVIRGYAQLLTMKASDEEYQKKTGRLIMENVDLIDERISAMYRAFSPSSAEPAALDISEEVFRVVHSCEEEYQKRIEVTAEGHVETLVNHGAFQRMIECFVCGFNWKGYPHASIIIHIGSPNGSPQLVIEYRNVDFSAFHTDWFFLPFADKANFKTGTELFEIYCLADANGWGFDLLKESDKNGFVVSI